MRISPRFQPRSKTMMFGIAALCVLSVFAGVNAFAVVADETTIRTSTGEFKLVPSDPSELVDEAALRSARRTTELALAAVAADMSQLEDRMETLDKDFESFDKQLDAAKAELNTRKRALDAELDAHEGRIDAFINDLKVYNAEVDEQRAEVDASNTLRADKRNSATVSRLNEWGERLDVRWAALESRREGLDREGQAYDHKAEEYDEYRENKVAEMALAYEKLIRRQAELAPKLDEAYRQLELCYAYARKIEKLLSEKYNVNESSSTGLMQDVGERLKELSNAGFDGSTTDKPELTFNK